MKGLGLKITDMASIDARQLQDLLKRPVTSSAEQSASVADIIKQVRHGGDRTVLELTRNFDGVDPVSFEIGDDELRMAEKSINGRLSDAIRDASERISQFHAADMPVDCVVETAPGLNCTVTYRPLTTVGIYIPGGTAPLVSTVLMLAIPAQLAGCNQVIMCSPPGRDGKIPQEMLAAASLCGVDRVFCVGGAQAIAAMAYGTESIPRCKKIFGPGNSWVTEAKQQVSLDAQGAAIDMPAGPSEVMVIADAAAGAGQGVAFIAWDLLSQAEHGPDSQVLLVTDSHDLAEKVMASLDDLAGSSRRSDILQQSLRAARIILVADLEEAMEIANEYAPEHLILNTANAPELAGQVENAGSVFIGRWTPESLGDYCSGTNHVLPTYGFARSHGALGMGDFMRRMTFQEASATALQRVGPTAEVLAETEGLEAHRMAVRVRLDSMKVTS